VLNLGPGVREAIGEDAEEIAKRLRSLGWRVYVLSPNISDAQSFFASIRATTPLDPPDVCDGEWDSLDDCLWEGLYESDENRIAIVWPRTRTLAKAAPDEYENARGVLANVARELEDPQATLAQPKTLMVVLA
jgi:hypothetical protein